MLRELPRTGPFWRTSCWHSTLQRRRRHQGQSTSSGAPAVYLVDGVLDWACRPSWMSFCRFRVLRGRSSASTMRTQRRTGSEHRPATSPGKLLATDSYRCRRLVVDGCRGRTLPATTAACCHGDRVVSSTAAEGWMMMTMMTRRLPVE